MARADPAQIECDASDSWLLTIPNSLPPTRAVELINVPFSGDHSFYYSSIRESKMLHESTWGRCDGWLHCNPPFSWPFLNYHFNPMNHLHLRPSINLLLSQFWASSMFEHEEPSWMMKHTGWIRFPPSRASPVDPLFFYSRNHVRAYIETFSLVFLSWKLLLIFFSQSRSPYFSSFPLLIGGLHV